MESEQVPGEHKRLPSEESGSVIINSITHSRSSSSSSNDPEVSPKSSPPLQVMDMDDNNKAGTINYYPSRITSSVLERSKSNIAADWSFTSNESLFSIHLGRHSLTVDFMKSGELYKSGELLSYSPALPMPPQSNKEVEEVVVVDETHKDEDDEKEEHPAVSWKTSTTSYRSNRSSSSMQSFSFPILVGAARNDSAKTVTEDKNEQYNKQSQDTQEPKEAVNQKHSTMCRWFSCFPPCPCSCS